MNRTVAFLSVAGGMALLALVLATPGPASGGHPLPPAPPAPTVLKPPEANAPAGSLTLNGRLSHPLVQTGTSEVFATVDVSGRELPGMERASVNLAVVIDRSGSMAGEKLRQAKQAARQLVQQLREGDRLTVVHYGSDVRALPGMYATASNKEQMLAFVDRIVDDGGTNIGDGLASGRSQVQRALGDFKVNRIILISDGQPTEGLTHPGALTRLAGSIRAEGISVSAIGVGVDFNENLMAGIAENGAGAYAYLRDASMLATIFQKDLQQAGTTVARNVELSFELPPGIELDEVLGYQFSRAGRTVRVQMPDVAAGQTERVVVRLNVTGRSPGDRIEVAGLRLAYTDLLTDSPAAAVAQLAAHVSDRPEEIAARRDKEVAVFSARAQAAQNLSRAADLLAKGERKEADQYLKNNEALFGEAASIAGAAAVFDDVAEQRELRRGMVGATAPQEVQHQVKAAKRKALLGFGMGSVY